MGCSSLVQKWSLVVDTTIFTFRGNLYQQSSGFPMGSPISPGACNTFCEQFVEEALQSCPEEIRPSTWHRYMDDVVEVIKKDNVKEFTAT